MYGYFYGEQAEQFSFYRIPKVFFTDEQFRNISTEAKILYGILLDRMTLSQKNGWADKDGRIYIIYTVDDIMEAMGCGNQKANKMLFELEDKCGLIERKRQGLGKPNIIFLKNFINASNSHIKKCENHISGDVKITGQDMLKSHTNNTDINKTYFNDTDNINPFLSERRAENEREAYREIIKENLEYDILMQRNPYSKDDINEILELILDTVCSTQSYIRVGKDNKPQAVVKSQLLKLTCEHIEYCIQCLKENTTDVRNIRQYLLATLYNSTITFSNYYKLKVQHDMASDNFYTAGGE